LKKEIPSNQSIMKKEIPSNNKRLIIFDLDGVLLDSRDNMEFSWKKATAKAGVEIPFERYFNEIGRPFCDIMERLGLGGRSEQIESSYRTASMEGIELLKFYPDVPETLEYLLRNGFKLGVVTSKDALRTSAILAMLSITFTCVQAPDKRLRGKPAPDQLLMAMAQSNIDPQDTIYIGDMDTDYEAACRAGIDFAYASWGYGSPPPNNNWALSDIAQLKGLNIGSF